MVWDGLGWFVVGLGWFGMVWDGLWWVGIVFGVVKGVCGVDKRVCVARVR